MANDHTLPLIIQAPSRLPLPLWLRDNWTHCLAQLRTPGALLFRGFEPLELSGLARLVEELCGPLLEYEYASTPRRKLEGRVYTATEYSPKLTIPLHNEQSYTRRWPRLLWFHCLQPAAEGGATLLADSRRVLARISDDVRRRFSERGIRYVRNYGSGVDLTWQRAFGTEDPKEVEETCRAWDIEFEWKTDGGLRTWQVCQATTRHPETGAEVWFNQAHLFHVTSLPEDVRDGLLAAFAEEELPRHAYFGDGSPIAPADLDVIRDAYDRETIGVQWEAGDVLVVDNLLVAHGRAPFSGARRLAVVMAGASQPDSTLHSPATAGR